MTCSMTTPIDKNSIRDAHTPQPVEIFFNTMRYRSGETVHIWDTFRALELWFECFKNYPYIQMWQYMLICGVGAKPVTHLMQYHLLQWEVAKVKPLMNSNMALTVLNLDQKTPKGATTKIQVKRYERYKRDKILSNIPVERYNSVRYSRSKVQSRSHYDVAHL